MKRLVARLLVVAALGGAARLAAAQATSVPSDPKDDEKERDATARALERALVRQGGLVLRPWALEVEPGVTYAYRDASAVRRDTIVGALAGRLGLPLGAQAEVRVPWMIVDRSPGLRSGSGLGDVELGLTEQLLAASPGSSTPDLLLAGRWKTTTGASGGDLPPGTGAHSIQGVLTAVGRDDPLVFVGSAYYVWNRRVGEVVRGDAIGLVLRTLLAVTPNTSLLIDVDAATLRPTRVGGRAVPGSDRLAAVLELGLSTLLARELFFNVTAGIGITPVAPALQLALALPFRW